MSTETTNRTDWETPKWLFNLPERYISICCRDFQERREVSEVQQNQKSKKEGSINNSSVAKLQQPKRRAPVGKITIKKMSVPSKGGVTVSFERTMPGQEVPDAITYQSEAEPSEGFTDALAALVPEVIVIAELPDNQKKGMKIVGVTFSYSGESHKMGAAISVTKLLAGSDSPLSFTTPCKVSINAGEDAQQDKGKLTKDQEKKLNKLLKEIEKYIDGGKLQVNMFDKKEK